MKNLDKTKAYDLRYLNDEHLEYLLCWLRNNDKGWGGYNISVLKKYGLLGFKEDFNCWVLDYLNKEIETTSALELFELQIGDTFELQIGDTFEYNGYICEVKEPIKRWYFIKDLILNLIYYIKDDSDSINNYNEENYLIKEITNQQLIKLLEENEIH